MEELAIVLQQALQERFPELRIELSRPSPEELAFAKRLWVDIPWGRLTILYQDQELRVELWPDYISLGRGHPIEFSDPELVPRLLNWVGATYNMWLRAEGFTWVDGVLLAQKGFTRE